MLQQLAEITHTDNISQILRKGSENHSAIQILQQSLFDLGYASVLDWERTGASGDFGSPTTLALQQFATKNGLTTDGTEVSPELIKVLSEKYEIAYSLRALKDVLDLNEVESTLTRNSDDTGAVESLQIILFKLGFGTELNWEKWGADGGYGGSTAAAVKACAAKEGISSDGNQVSKELLQRILAKFTSQLGPDWGKSKDNSTARLALPPSIKPHKNGVYDAGRLEARSFIEQKPELLAQIGMSPSTMKIISAVSQNEGKLEAINTYDNSFMTFGMFQWTIGAGTDNGELAALLKKIKLQDVHVFHKYFGQYGLDVHDKKTDLVYGLLTLNGRALNTPRRKERLRTHEWALRFWKAGHEPLVQAIEIEHAANRLKSFYWHERYRTNGHLLSELITSEYGVALLLDNHVNRPAWVDDCVYKAIKQTGLSSNPNAWSTTEEQKLLGAYLDIRKTYQTGTLSPMTHSEQRAALIGKLKLSKERGSFQFEPVKSRSLGAGPSIPQGYQSKDYSMIRMRDDV